MFGPSHHDPRHHHRDPRGGPRHGDLPFGFRDVFRREAWQRGQIRRGEIRPLVLAALSTRPMHGYEVIQELEARSGGRWRPSAGSVYPTLQLLADEGLVSSEDVDGRRVYTITDAGRQAAAATPAPDPWVDRGGGREPGLREVGAQLMAAMVQVERIGSPAARREALRILSEARRQLYRLLAEDEPVDGDDVAPESGTADTGDSSAS
ncbi:MAG TPA: PadR family transcriptional regulator [Candidatus Dormibacteraeota bacterium]|nr:PadR family transcriptional regulator [Candidatus Dormibacteraeota bacterium]